MKQSSSKEKWERRGDERQRVERREKTKETGGKVNATNATALMASLACRVGWKNNTQLSVKSVKWPQLTVSSCHGYCPHSAVIVWLSPSSTCTEVCLQLVCVSVWKRRRDNPSV